MQPSTLSAGTLGRLLPLLFLGPLLLPRPVEGQDLGSRFTSQPTQPFTKDPGGAKLGEIYINTPVQVVEQRGGWVKVTVEGWLREGGLSEQKKAVGRGLQGVQPLELEDYSTKEVTEGVTTPRVYVTLKLKNATERLVAAWDALLVGQSIATGQVLFREPVSDSGKQIAPGETVEVAFFWENSEAPYEHLRGATPQTLKLELFKVTVK